MAIRFISLLSSLKCVILSKGTLLFGMKNMFHVFGNFQLLSFI